jgi:hypothetical protein
MADKADGSGFLVSFDLDVTELYVMEKRCSRITFGLRGKEKLL